MHKIFVGVIRAGGSDLVASIRKLIIRIRGGRLEEVKVGAGITHQGLV